MKKIFSNMPVGEFQLVETSVLERLVEAVGEIAEQNKKLIEQQKKVNKYLHYPPWITKDEAKEILRILDDRTFKKWVKRGIISVKSINEQGTNLRYATLDCLDFPERVEDWIKRNC